MVWLVLALPHLPWAAILPLGVLYAVSLSWSINSICHNQIHNPYFRSPLLNRLFNLCLSVTIGFSQTLYKDIHNRHHSGNSDRPDAGGKTVDPLSIYRHGRDGTPENPWRYTFLGALRDGGDGLSRKRKRPVDARWAAAEVAGNILLYGGLAVWNWHAVAVLLPFWYLGQSLSSLNGYYEHFGADPDKPIAWGVSSYGFFYNLFWMNNGYHAEHHYRPKTHWTRMKALHREIAAL